MMLSERRRALMAGGGGGWTRVFGFYYHTTEYYQSGDIITFGNGYVGAEIPVSSLVGPSSEYVIAQIQEQNQIFIIPRENMSDSNVDSVKCNLKIEYTGGDNAGMVENGTDFSVPAFGTFNFVNMSSGVFASLSSRNGRNYWYIHDEGHVPSIDDSYFDFYMNFMPDPVGGGACPSGGSHDFSTAGQPAYPLPNYPCPSCGQTGYCAQQYTQCTKCSAMSEYVRCQNCGWQSG